MGFPHGLPETESPTRVVGRLQLFQDNWKIVTRDQWVWEAVRGFPIPLTGQPHQGVRPTPPYFFTEQISLLQGEMQSLLDKGAIVPVPPEEKEGFYSSLFFIANTLIASASHTILHQTKILGGYGPHIWK